MPVPSLSGRPQPQQAKPTKQGVPVGTTDVPPSAVPPVGSAAMPQLPTDASQSKSLVTYYRLRSHTLLDEQKLAAPIAAKPGSQPKTSEIITVALGTAELLVEWQAWRKGERPQLPQPYTNDPNLTLLKNRLVFEGYEEESDTVKYFMASGEMRYAWNQRGAATLSYPVAPFYAIQDASMLVVTTGDFIPNTFTLGWPNPAAKTAITKS